MSEKPKSPTSKSAKSTGDGASTGVKKKKPVGEPDDTFDFLAPPQASGELGRLEHYRILKVLGRGGMGIVFMAEDTRLSRIVALKVMLPSIAKKEIARDRFIREAQATAAIEHDHIVTIYHVSDKNSPVPYFVMQFLKGMTLEDWLKAGKTLNVPQIMRIGKEIAKGLAAAHSRGLIHRDIKPSNVWLDAPNKGRVKILDFGLARPTNEETHLTQEGMILGSPAYMSPEQARGNDVDERCDLFSLGCVLYRLCAGKLPFAGKDAMTMLVSITTDTPVALKQLNVDLPPALADLVHQLLAKKPENRPASAKDVVQTIQSIERDWVANAKTTAVRPVKGTPSPAGTEETIAANVEAIDPALEESAITDLEDLLPTERSQTAPAPRGRSWIFAGLGCSLMTVIAILCCLAYFVTTNQGTVTVTAQDETAEGLLKDAGLTVRDHNKQAHALKIGTQKLPAAGYDVDISDLPKGLHIEPSHFSVGKGETIEIKIRYVPPRTAPPIVVVKADEAKRIQQEWAEYLKRDIIETIHLSVKKEDVPMKFVLIPPGEFLMGSTKEQTLQLASETKKPEKASLPAGYLKHIQSEAPQHRVRISKAFYMGYHEVTFAQFSRFCTAAAYTSEPQESGKGGTGIEFGKEAARKREFTWITPGYEPTKDHPVTNVTWADAEKFCAWLSKKEGKTFRLPTEAEWEHACRAGTTTAWSFGSDIVKESKSREHMHFHVPFKFSGPLTNPATPKPVAKLRANEFGIYDMHGNVAEMCADYWGPAYYETLKDALAVDPTGPDADPGQGRVVRGGSFLDTPATLRSAYRKGVDPTLGFATIGFRVVCEVTLPAD